MRTLILMFNSRFKHIRILSCPVCLLLGFVVTCAAQRRNYSIGWESFVQKQYHKDVTATGIAIVFDMPFFKIHNTFNGAIRARIGHADGTWVWHSRASMHLNANVDALVRFSLLENYKVSPVFAGGAGLHYRKSLIEERGRILEGTSYHQLFYAAPLIMAGARFKIAKLHVTAGLHLRPTNDIDEWGYSVLFRW